MMALPPGPYKPYSSNSVGEHVQNNYEFFNDIFDDKNYRDDLFAMDQDGLRKELEKEYGLKIPPEVKIVLIDLESARMQPDDIDPTRDTFYQLVMPPTPRRHPGSPEYKHDQAWEDAWYHAIVDSYGM
jgi:hypothetical protein